VPNRKTSSHRKTAAKCKSKETGKTRVKKPAQPITDILKQARTAYYQKQFKETVELLSGISRPILRKDDAFACEVYRLLCFALANLGDLKNAEEYAEKGLNLARTDPDFYFVKTYLFAAYKDYDNVLESARLFSEFRQSREEKPKEMRPLSAGHEFLIYNYIGLAHKAHSQFKEAIEAFEKAIALKKEDSLPYLNLANLYLQQRDFETASSVIDKGLLACTQVQELQLLKKTLTGQATISACMIVKNEEELLPVCLESIRDWVDEIIIVDTGSTDRTVEIAQSYGAQVFHQEWTGDFSLHRNQSIERATKDWIFIIDADEEFDPSGLPPLRQALTQGEYPLLMMNVFNVDKNTRRVSSHLPSIRFFRRRTGIRYDGIVHNQLKYHADDKILKVEASLWHYGYDLSKEKMRRKFERTRTLLEKQLRENPAYAFAHFNLAQLYRSIDYDTDDQVHEKALYHARKVMELAPPQKTIHLMAHHQAAAASFRLGNLNNAEDYCLKALALKPDYIDPMLLLGHIYVNMSRFDDAEIFYLQYLEFQEKVSADSLKEDILLIFIKSRHIAYYNLGLLKEAQGKLDDAEKYFLETLKFQEPFETTYLKLSKIYLRKNRLEEAKTYIDKELVKNPNSVQALFYLGQYRESQGNLVEAETAFEAAFAGAENHVELFKSYGSLLLRMNKFPEAANVLERLTSLNPDLPKGWELLGDALAGAADYRRAYDAYRRLQNLGPENSIGWIGAGNCCFRMEQYEDAEKYYSRAMEIGKELGFLYRNLGLTKYRLGKLEESLALLEKYSEIAPDDLEGDYALGSIYCRMGRYADAIGRLEKFLRTRPNSIDALFDISECYLQMGYPDSALIGYRQVLKHRPDFKPARERLEQLQPDAIQA